MVRTAISGGSIAQTIGPLGVALSTAIVLTVRR